MLPIFTKAEKAEPIQRTRTDVSGSAPPAAVPEVQKPAVKDQVSHRPTTRRVSGKDAYATPSISGALRDVPSYKDKESSDIQVKASAPADIKNQPFSQEKLAEAWKTFVDKIDSPQLKSALSTKEPGLKDEWHVEYVLDNELQSHRLTHDLKPKLLRHLRRELSNESVEIEFIISAHAQGPAVPYTESEKWQVLVEKYPALAYLKAKFGLDFDQY